MTAADLHATVLEPGPWDPARWPSADGPADALLVVEGLVVRELLLGDDGAAQLLGPGDVAAVTRPAEEVVPVEVRWTVAVATRVVPLGQHVHDVLRTAPEVLEQVLGRAVAQQERQAVHRAIVQLPRVEQRVLGLLWLLGQRYGRVTAEGIVLPFAFTHALLGRLVGARRSTVTLAIKALAEDGSVRRRADGTWVLSPDGLEQLTPTGVAVTSTAPVRVLQARGDLDTRLGGLGGRFRRDDPPPSPPTA